MANLNEELKKRFIELLTKDGKPPSRFASIEYNLNQILDAYTVADGNKKQIVAVTREWRTNLINARITSDEASIILNNISGFVADEHKKKNTPSVTDAGRPSGAAVTDSAPKQPVSSPLGAKFKEALESNPGIKDMPLEGVLRELLNTAVGDKMTQTQIREYLEFLKKYPTDNITIANGRYNPETSFAIAIPDVGVFRISDGNHFIFSSQLAVEETSPRLSDYIGSNLRVTQSPLGENQGITQNDVQELAKKAWQVGDVWFDKGADKLVWVAIGSGRVLRVGDPYAVMSREDFKNDPYQKNRWMEENNTETPPTPAQMEEFVQKYNPFNREAVVTPGFADMLKVASHSLLAELFGVPDSAFTGAVKIDDIPEKYRRTIDENFDNAAAVIQNLQDWRRNVVEGLRQAIKDPEQNESVKRLLREVGVSEEAIDNALTGNVRFSTLSKIEQVLSGKSPEQIADALHGRQDEQVDALAKETRKAELLKTSGRIAVRLS